MSVKQRYGQPKAKPAQNGNQQSPFRTTHNVSRNQEQQNASNGQHASKHKHLPKDKIIFNTVAVVQVKQPYAGHEGGRSVTQQRAEATPRRRDLSFRHDYLQRSFSMRAGWSWR